jgi:hypothetical protein
VVFIRDLIFRERIVSAILKQDFKEMKVGNQRW